MRRIKGPLGEKKSLMGEAKKKKEGKLREVVFVSFGE